MYYLEMVTSDVDALANLYATMHHVTFGAPDADLGHARVATLKDGSLWFPEIDGPLVNGKVRSGTSKALGDLPGHEFHGNQWTQGASLAERLAEPDAGFRARVPRRDRRVESLPRRVGETRREGATTEEDRLHALLGQLRFQRIYILD